MAHFDPLDPNQPTVEFLMTAQGRVRNPHYKPQLVAALKHDHRPLEHRLRDLVHSQQVLRGKVHPQARIPTSLKRGQRPTNISWIESYQKHMTGHVSIQPYSGQGTDSAIQFVQGIIDYRDQHGLQIRQLYEIVCEGIGSFFIRFTDEMNRLLSGISSHPSSPGKTDYGHPWIMKYIDEMVGESSKVQAPR